MHSATHKPIEFEPRLHRDAILYLLHEINVPLPGTISVDQSALQLSSIHGRAYAMIFLLVWQNSQGRDDNR